MVPVNSGQFEPLPPGSTHATVTGAPGGSSYSYFYSNRHFQEVRATLRYGIEARKGLILFTGEAGRGKTTLLHRLIHELENDVTFVVESDPGASFSALLNLLARNLQGEVDASDRLSLLQSCKHALRSEVDRNGTVCLLIDNAERMREDTLESVLQNFLTPATPADRGQPLLQLILAGRPELRARWRQPRRRSLAPAPGLVCHIESLNPKESAEYIEHRLQAGRPPPSACDSEAIERIAAYAGGDLRLTNSLCSSVLTLAARAPTPAITADLVAAAAHELGLPSPRPAVSAAAKAFSKIPLGPEEAFRFHLDDRPSTDVVGPTFLLNDEDELTLSRGRRDRTTVRVLLGVIFLAAVFLWLRHQLGGLSLWNWSERIKAWSGAPQPPSPAPRIGSAQSVIGAELDPLPAPSEDAMLPPAVDQNLAQQATPEFDTRPAGPPSISKKQPDRQHPVDQPKSPARNASSPARSERLTLNRPENNDQQLEMEIYKAIGNRAILGVAVSVNNGTAYLEGRVATERQRRAAERAARSVEGVERVRNRISVG
jgi:type II secretory pathway predicted ATPase ExeA